MSYSAIVARVNTFAHPNADRLQLGMCRGYQVIVGMDTQDGELGLLLPPDGQLSHEYCMANNLYARHPETGEKMSGFFGKNRRVTAQRFRGEKSEAYWAPLSSLRAMMDTGPFARGRLTDPEDVLKEGDELTSYMGKEVCRKYETPATRKAKMNRGMQPKKHNPAFRKHFDTPQLRKDIWEIPQGALVYLTEKLHGTSGRFGYLPEPVEPTFREKLGAWIAGGKWTPEKYAKEYLLGTRNIILGKWEGDSYYGKEGFRYALTDSLKGKLHYGETLYFEIVGYTEEGSPIMPPVSTSALKGHKVDIPGGIPLDFTSVYGEKMSYSYGCWPQYTSYAYGPDFSIHEDGFAQHRMYVYRITQQTPDGIPLDLSWEQVKGRCAELKIYHVPQLLDAPMVMHWGETEEENRAAVENCLRSAGHHAKGPSTIDSKHIREGVCIRWEKGTRIGILKEKSFEFLVLEGVVKAQEDYVDMEEIA